ncbi:glycosyltransferase family 2 protein [Candidatus Pacearchaeota archaeon]|nr:glycosyltransferase family 2 protein [Candidatus Pacearchaeota archaeon]
MGQKIMFSVCLCSWDDLNYLKLLYSSFKKYTKLPCEFIVHDNGSEDGTEKWLQEKQIVYSRSEENLGVSAVNFAVEKAKYNFIVDINADMFFLPGWDIALLKQIKKFESQNIDKFIISSRLIEPIGNNPEYQIFNCGSDWESFDEDKLLNYYFKIKANHEESIQYSHPICLSRKLWNDFGGADTGYQYGIATDHDIPISAYEAGCRHFIELAKPTIFHFSCKTVSKLPLNRLDGQKRFYDKWGITIEQFRHKMKIGQKYEKVSDNVFEGE